MTALLWMAFSVVILCFPADTMPTAAAMNYTAAVLGGWIILCVIYFYFPVIGGRYWFTGPVANIERESSSAGGSSTDLEKISATEVVKSAAQD